MNSEQVSFKSFPETGQRLCDPRQGSYARTMTLNLLRLQGASGGPEEGSHMGEFRDIEHEARCRVLDLL